MPVPALRPPSLRGRVVLTVAALAALLVATSAVTLIGQAYADAATARVTQQALPGMVAVEKLERAFVDQQTAIRGYVLTGQDQLLEPYRAAPALLAEQEALLRGALADQPAVPAQLDVVLRAHRTWLDAAAPAIALRAEGRQAELDALVAASPGVPLFADLRRQTGELRELIAQRVAADTSAAATVRSVLAWVLGGAALVAVLGVVAAAVGIRRALTRPLAQLVDAVERVADGDLDRSVPTAGPPELAVVGGAVDRMRLMLNEHRRAEVRAAELRESDRVAADLRDGVVHRLFGLSMGLTALSARTPALAGELARPIAELDRVIAEVRAAATGVGGPEAAQRSALTARVGEVLDRVPDLLGVDPDLRVGSTSPREVPEPVVEELVSALERAVDGLAEVRARLDAVEVEVEVAAGAVALSLTARGVVPGEWTAGLRAGASPGVRRVVDLDPELVVVEWTVPLDG
jgi:CHASE3 domain sensor protein